MKQPAPSLALRWTGLAACTLALAACSSDDDSTPAPPPAPNSSTSFSSSLDRAATVNNATLGALVRISVRNNAPQLGTFQTPVWLGLHDGTFDIYDSGQAASAALESLAEDGDASALETAFQTAAVGAGSATVGSAFTTSGGPLRPSEVTSTVFRVDPANANARYLSWASMVIPSNDAFIANGDPVAHELFDSMGAFTGTSFTVVGDDVLDAGTEVNDEIETAGNTAFFGQIAPNTGTAEGGVIGVHPGFVAAMAGNILGDPMFSNADFKAVGYEVLDVTIEDASSSLAEPIGSASISVNAMTLMATVDVTATGLSGPATLLHLHRGATGVAGPVIVDLFPIVVNNSGGALTARGDVAITEADLVDLRAGRVYFNLHTALNPAGEVRGQVGANNASFAALDVASNVTAPAVGTDLRIAVQNRAPDLGTFQTPVWVGLHDGAFDMFDAAAAVSADFERLAEDGDAAPLGALLGAVNANAVRGLIAGSAGRISPGESAARTFRVDGANAANRYLSWASMVIPSNDAFIGNDAPQAHEMFDAGGTFTGAAFTVAAADALDAGSEVNDEIPANTAFFGQTTPNTGVVEASTVGPHPGFAAAMVGNILGDAMFTNADFFNTAGYEFLSVDVEEIAVTTPAASGVATIRMSGGTATIDISAANLTGAATEVTLRNAAVGVDGPALVDLTPDVDLNSGGSLDVNGTFTPDMIFMTALAAGEIYVQVTTRLNPTGELRGQVSLAP